MLTLGRFIFTVSLKPKFDSHAAAEGICSACDTQMYSIEKGGSVSLFITSNNANDSPTSVTSVEQLSVAEFKDE